MPCRCVPERCVPERKVSDVPSLGQCVPWTIYPLDEASLGRGVPRSMHPLDNTSLGRFMHPFDDAPLGYRVTDRCVPTLDRDEVLVMTSQFWLG
jgi:hypothetical protein